MPKLLLRARRRDDEPGQIIVLFALVIVVIMAFTALVVDVGLLRNNRSTLINAMDAGALAGGTLMPVDGLQAGATAKVTSLVRQTVEATYPGIGYNATCSGGGGDYCIEYRCVIGVDGTAPRVSDIPIVCNPTKALGHTPGSVSTDFIGAGPTRSSICRPDLGDKCNTVVVRGDINTRFSFGGAVGVNSGNTGTVSSAACNGPCGELPAVPVDVVLVIDRSDSMSGDEGNLRTAAKAVLQAYNPAFQHVALGMLGPSTLSEDCSGSPDGTFAIPLERLTTQAPQYRTDTSNATGTGGATSLSISKPSGTAIGDVLVAGIVVDGGSGTTVTPPTGAGGWTQIRRTNNGTNVGVVSYYHKVTADDASTTAYAFTLSPSRRAAGGIIRFSGVDLDNVVDVSSGATGNDENVEAASIDPTLEDTMLVGFFGIDTGTTFDNADSMTEQFDVRSGSNGGSGPTISGNTDPHGDDDDTDDRTAEADEDDRYAAQLIALRPTPVVQSYGTDPTIKAHMDSWIPVGLTGTGVSVPPVAEPVPYIIGKNLQTSTKLVRAIDCFQLSGTGTNLATPMAMAREYLKKYGRTDPKVKKGIIFETDGTPNYNNWTGDPLNYRCAQAKTEAGLAKAAGIEIFTIGFGVNGQNCPDGGESAVSFLASLATDSFGTPTCNASENTDNDHFFCQPAGSSLTAVFQAAAAELADLRSHLIQVYPIPIVNSISPASGTHSSSVTITGQFFTGATAVEFGGAAASFTVLSDTTIRATPPAGNPGDTVHVTVSTPGGASPRVDSDRFTYR